MKRRGLIKKGLAQKQISNAGLKRIISHVNQGNGLCLNGNIVGSTGNG